MTALWMDYGDEIATPPDSCPICGAEDCSLRHIRDRLMPAAIIGARIICQVLALLVAVMILNMLS